MYNHSNRHLLLIEIDESRTQKTDYNLLLVLVQRRQVEIK